MTHYEPAATVLPYFTDECLHNGTTYGPKVAATLLRVPPEYRQPVEAEATARSSRIVTVGGFLTSEPTADIHEVRRQVVAEVLAQLDREGVTR